MTKMVNKYIGNKGFAPESSQQAYFAIVAVLGAGFCPRLFLFFTGEFVQVFGVSGTTTFYEESQGYVGGCNSFDLAHFFCVAYCRLVHYFNMTTSIL